MPNIRHLRHTIPLGRTLTTHIAHIFRRTGNRFPSAPYPFLSFLSYFVLFFAATQVKAHHFPRHTRQTKATVRVPPRPKTTFLGKHPLEPNGGKAGQTGNDPHGKFISIPKGVIGMATTCEDKSLPAARAARVDVMQALRSE
jgi:hypothetical protein